MGVILPVAGVAIRGQRDLGHVPPHVAGLAIETAVLTGQRIARLLVVIEPPSGPTIRIVAESAVRPQTTLMMLVPVAGRAGERRALE